MRVKNFHTKGEDTENEHLTKVTTADDICTWKRNTLKH